MKFCVKIFSSRHVDLEIIIMNYFFFLIALYFINKICIEIKDKRTGIIAMLLFALTPVVYGASRQYGHHDFHVMCISLLNVYSLIKLENFTNKKWSVIYGISVGIGLLAKDTFLVYFFVPYLYVVIRSLKNDFKKNKKQKIINILITIFVGSLIAGCHYFRLETIVKILKDPFLEQTFSYFDYNNIRIFTTGMSEYLLSFPLFLLFVISVFWIVLKYKNTKYKYIFLLWLIVPWTVLMLMRHHKVPDYGLGLIPPIIIIVSLYVSNIKKSIYKGILSVCLLLILLLQYISFSYGINIGLFNLKIKMKEYDFCYFDKSRSVINDIYLPNIMCYNHKKRDCCLSMSKYLENNFKNKVFFMLKHTETEDFSMHELSVLLRLKGYKVFIHHQDVLAADIIALNNDQTITDVKKFLDIEKEIHKQIGVVDDFLEEEIISIVDGIENNYIKIDEFDLDVDCISDRNHIIILGKKDLFDKNSKLKYKYKLLKF